jgi:acetyl-CoA acetyltransferase
MPEAVIIDAIRTPIGALGGVLSAVRPDDLAAHILKALVERTGIDPALVEEVYMGCANQAGEDNRNVARMASLLAGFPVERGMCTSPVVWKACHGRHILFLKPKKASPLAT